MIRRSISLRTRLTLVYGSLFLLMGVVLEAVTYLITRYAVNTKFQVLITNPLGVGAGGQPSDAPDAGPGGVAGIQASRDLFHQLGRQQRALLNQLIQSSVLTLVAVVVLAVVLGYVVSGRIVRPLRQITATGQRLSESNLHERIGLTGPDDEIKDLADTFDRMLDRLHRAFDSQRRFIANASHELRTPLAINRTLIDVAVAKPGAPDEVRALGDRLLDTIARQERLINGLLLLARSEHELQERAVTDLAPLAANAIEQLAESARTAGVSITQTLLPAPTNGDVVLLERCAINLLENAIKYNSAEAQVWVRTGESDGRAWLQIENTGPPISVDQVQAIFEPFRRLKVDRVGSARGAGLGLSIVRAVVLAHDGIIEALPRPSGGLLVSLALAVDGSGGNPR